MELVDIGNALQAQLFGSREDEFDELPVFKKNPTLLSRLVSKLTYSVRDAAPRYIAVDMSHVANQGGFDIAVYTDDLIFFLTYDPTVDHITTTAVSRSSIRSVELLSAPNFMAGVVPGTYQGSVQVLVSYENLNVKLPGDNRASERNHRELDTFLASLFRDLARTH
ncbi:MAG: hypothetical protein JWQ68_2166 [Cryobacterium sp.]|jgi:hypothetical protein|nr:hypothetical protein [Cryobacterium sp.]